MRRLLPGTLAIAMLALLLGGCSQPEVTPEHQAAWDVFEDAREQMLGLLTDDSHPEYVGLAELGIKPPAGIALYVDGMDVNYGESDKEPDPRYAIAVVNLADGVIFGEQYPRGAGARRFDTIEEYDAWDWQEHAAGLPHIYGALDTYGLQLEQAQRAFYEANGTFAQAEELVAFSVGAPGPVPDVTPLAGYSFAASSDRYGYLMTVESPFEDYTMVVVGYGSLDHAHSYGTEDLDEMIAEYDGNVLYIGINDDTGHPLPFVEVDPTDLDENGEVPAVELPAPSMGVSGR